MKIKKKVMILNYFNYTTGIIPSSVVEVFLTTYILISYNKEIFNEYLCNRY